MLQPIISDILQEISTVLSAIDEKQVNRLVKQIIKSNVIVVAGAGRVGMITRGFGMRLGHLGFKAYALGDSTLPSIHKKDLLLISSGSGETPTIYDLVKIAKKNGATVALVTGNKRSRMGKLADIIVELKAPSKTKAVPGLRSIQPMTTLNEQCLGLFYDVVVLRLMDQTNQAEETMLQRHSNLE